MAPCRAAPRRGTPPTPPAGRHRSARSPPSGRARRRSRAAWRRRCAWPLRRRERHALDHRRGVPRGEQARPAGAPLRGVLRSPRRRAPARPSDGKAAVDSDRRRHPQVPNMRWRHPGFPSPAAGRRRRGRSTAAPMARSSRGTVRQSRPAAREDGATLVIRQRAPAGDARRATPEQAVRQDAPAPDEPCGGGRVVRRPRRRRRALRLVWRAQTRQGRRQAPFTTGAARRSASSDAQPSAPSPLRRHPTPKSSSPRRTMATASCSESGTIPQRADQIGHPAGQSPPRVSAPTASLGHCGAARQPPPAPTRHAAHRSTAAAPRAAAWTLDGIAMTWTSASACPSTASRIAFQSIACSRVVAWSSVS